MAQGLFITGTDTNVGKTVVATGLALKLGTKYWKPVQTGMAETTDSAFAANFLGECRILRESYGLKHPSSPHIAAEMEGITIEMSEILRWLPEIVGPVVVEGAGGVLVPLNDRETILDLIVQLKFPTVVVASSRLGTINHTLLALQALASKSASICGFISVGDENRRVFETIADFSRCRWLGHINRAEFFSTDWFEREFQNLDWEYIAEKICWTPSKTQSN